MKATFSVAGDGEFPNQPNYELAVCFNGLPGTVVLEVHEITNVGYSGESGNPIGTVSKQQKAIFRTPMKASEARAIASAILSAATQAKL